MSKKIAEHQPMEGITVFEVENKIDHLTYLPDMEQIDPSIRLQVEEAFAASKGYPSIQMSYDKFERHPDFAREFQEVGVSVHGVNEAEHVERQGADFCIAGHIFTTQCKPGVEPRGLDFLRRITSNAAIPVYAIGGIDAHNIASVRDAGADGACLMSTLMTCDNVAETIDELRAALS